MDKFFERIATLAQKKKQKILTALCLLEKFITPRNLSTKNSPTQDGFTSELHQTSKEEISLVLHKLIQKTEKGLFPKLFFETSITKTKTLQGKKSTFQ